MDHARDTHQPRYGSYYLCLSLSPEAWLKPGCVRGERSTEPPVPWHGAGKPGATAPGAGTGWAASQHGRVRSRAWHSVAVPAQGESCA